MAGKVLRGGEREPVVTFVVEQPASFDGLPRFSRLEGVKEVEEEGEG